MLKLQQQTTKQSSPGKYYPCGATLTPDGVNFALFSEHAEEVFLLLFDDANAPPSDIIRVEQKTRHVWHIKVHDVGAGQLYGYRVRGPYHPAEGHRFNEQKLLICPYAQALTGKIRNKNRLLDGFDTAEGDLVIDHRDSASMVPKGIVIDNSFDWEGDQPPEIPFEKLVIYEAHLKGFTAHSSSGVAHPGTYLGFMEKIPYLTSLGINAVEFLPLHEFYVEDFLVNNHLTNYWGYNTAAFFAPESSYGTGSYPGCQVQEFKTMVRELHKAGIEVIMDVVYNHTGEGNEQGPTFSLKGIDNLSYYCLTGPAEEPYRYYYNHSGCGNTLRLANPHVLRLVMDSLRYWVEVMHVDGFRFDLASVLGRGGAGDFERNSAFFHAVAQDPVLNRVKLIAEPWDINTYQVGNFPVDWAEWNDRFRDTVRRFMRGDQGQVADLGWRFTGSADLFSHGGRSAFNSINFITCHDGFTLNDLVSYRRRHNQANREKNNDGAWENYSSNCGAEGESDDPHVRLMRRRMVKNFLSLLFFSTGTPLLLAGDEVLRTQHGNNNAYCQDNEISWFNWEDVGRNGDIFEFTRKAIALTQRYRVLHRKRFFDGCVTPDGVCDIVWYNHNLKHPVWSNPKKHTLCCQLAEEGGEQGPCALFFILNAAARQVKVKLPPRLDGGRWRRIVDTSLLAGDDFREPGDEAELEGDGTTYLAAAQSIVVLAG